MQDYLDIGATPPGENCEQVGTPGYDPVRAKLECRVFVKQLRRTLGDEPEGCRLVVKSHPHDFGTYDSVACVYAALNQTAHEYAYQCEAECPEFWDAEALLELGLVCPDCKSRTKHTHNFCEQCGKKLK